MNINEMTSALEAVLFASGEPMPLDRICNVFVIDLETAEKLIQSLRDRLDERKSGLRLVKLGANYQLCTAKEYGDYVRSALDLRRKTPLSAAAFEVLAVVAYNQPVTKAFVEQIRGVDCSGVITTLVDKQLLEEKGRLELPGRPLLYGTTDNFLRCFGLSSLSELPPLPKSREGDENSAEQMDLSMLQLGNLPGEGELNLPQISEQDKVGVDNT